jgi:hypothetical protein
VLTCACAGVRSEDVHSAGNVRRLSQDDLVCAVRVRVSRAPPHRGRHRALNCNACRMALHRACALALALRCDSWEICGRLTRAHTAVRQALCARRARRRAIANQRGCSRPIGGCVRLCCFVHYVCCMLCVFVCIVRRACVSACVCVRTAAQRDDGDLRCAALRRRRAAVGTDNAGNTHIACIACGRGHEHANTRVAYSECDDVVTAEHVDAHTLGRHDVAQRRAECGCVRVCVCVCVCVCACVRCVCADITMCDLSSMHAQTRVSVLHLSRQHQRRQLCECMCACLCCVHVCVLCAHSHACAHSDVLSVSASSDVVPRWPEGACEMCVRVLATTCALHACAHTCCVRS